MARHRLFSTGDDPMRNARIALLFPLALGAACNKGPSSEDFVGLDWSHGESFHVAATYKAAEMMGEHSAVDLDGESVPQFGDVWSDEVVWSFQVVETDLTPPSTDELYPYAVTATGEVASLAVLRAYVDASLNDDEALLDADPVVYLVFREDRGRLAAIISYVNRDGERSERAWSSKKLGRSHSLLSQSMLTELPTFLAPFSATWGDNTRNLENGSSVTSLFVDGTTTDVIYDDEIGGGLIVSRYEFGAPWPVETITDNVESRLLSQDEVSAKSSELRFYLPAPPEDFDYRAALRSSIDIDEALRLDADTIENGLDVAAHEGYRPWAGYWWPTKQGELIFGFETEDGVNWNEQEMPESYSDRVKEEIDVFKLKMDEISEDLRDMESTDEGYNEKRDAYRDQQKSLIEALRTFYDTLLQDFDGGRITVAEGKITHVDGWAYDIDGLSPMDKYGLVLYLRGQAENNPFYVSAWEILNSYNPGGESWWGHCNGWSAAAILTNEPTESVTFQAGGQDISFSVGDLKGLLSESHYSTYSSFYGERYNGEEDDVSDLTPAAFHKLVSYYLGEMGVPMVFDTTATEQVWNFPVWATTLNMEETTPAGAEALVNINTADKEALAALPEIGEAKSTSIIEYREANGPFQAIEDVQDVRGVGRGTFASIEALITVEPFRRTFEVSAVSTFATDGVDPMWVDVGDPEGFTKNYNYTLVTDADGLVLEGTWEDEKKHPDFAWIPYDNPMRSGQSSENPYLEYGTLLEVIGKSFHRE